MLSIFIFSLYIATSFGPILYFWYKKDIVNLRRLLFCLLFIAMLFSGNVITIAGLTLNLGVCIIVSYYMIGFVLIKELGQDGYLGVLRDHFNMVFIVFLICSPMILMQSAGLLVTNLALSTNLIDAILISKFNYMTIIGMVFYLGQLLYVHSYSFVERGGFLFEILGRIPIIMLMQSLKYYGLLFLVTIGTTGVYGMTIPTFLGIILGGAIARLIILCLIFYPFYYVYSKKIEGENCAST
jgi:hypothetical protein